MSNLRFVILTLLFVVGPLCACGDDDEGYGNAAGVGNYCEQNADCQTSECYLGPGGGYCTSPCSEEGSVADCPLDTVCKPIQGGARRCLLVCGSESACDYDDCQVDYCPDGSSCVDISNSPYKGCEPDPS